MSTQNGNRVIEVNFGNKFFVDADQTPEKSGIYAICRGKKENNIWRISKLLYIGEANNIKVRLTSNHEKKIPCAADAFLNKEELMFFIALVPNHENRELAEKVLIWKMKPKFNDCGVPHWLDSFLEIDRCKCSGLSTGSGRSKTRPTI